MEKKKKKREVLSNRNKKLENSSRMTLNNVRLLFSAKNLTI